MPSIRKSLALSFASRYTTLFIQLVSNMILARLLTPADIGIFSVAIAVTGLAHAVRGFGVQKYVIQEEHLTTDRIRTIFGLSLAISWTIALMLLAFSGTLSDFYDEPGLRQVLAVLSINFFVIPFGAPAYAILRRDMAFGPLYRMDFVTVLVHSVTAIVLAALGFGFISLAWASVAGVITTTVAAALFRPQIAGLLPNFSEWRHVVHFGGVSSATNLLVQSGSSAIDLIVGRMLGFGAVGFYSRAQGLVALFQRDFMEAVHNVAFPAFANDKRNDRELKASYLKGLTFVTVFAWPCYGFLGLMAYPLIRIMFGTQWDSAVTIVQILAVAAFFHASWSLGTHALLATGHVVDNLKAEALVQLSRIFLILLLVPYGLEVVAGAQILANVIGLIVFQRYLSSAIDMTFSDLFRATYPSFVTAACSLIIPVTVIMLYDIGPNNIWQPFLVAGVGSPLGWLGGIMLTRHPVRYEIALAWGKFCRSF